jgi:hypothetical protein
LLTEGGAILFFIVWFCDYYDYLRTGVIIVPPLMVFYFVEDVKDY